MNLHRRRDRELGLVELVAIAVGGMVGGGIFSILGISVSMVGFLTPVAIGIGGILALFAGYSYVKLGVYYKDEGATYSFIKRTYPEFKLAAAMIGWFIIFGYISTLSLYAYTFSAYAISSTSFADNVLVRKGVALGILAVFVLINVWSVKGMGRIEDLMVYTKIIILLVIAGVLFFNSKYSFDDFIATFQKDIENTKFFHILIVASITFVAYEGFQLVDNAVNEMRNPDKNIPRAIYSAIVLVAFIYIVIAIGAVVAIPKETLIKHKEYALASGTSAVLGKLGTYLVVLGAVLATSSAVSATVFGASRQMAVIADDGYFPKFLAKRKGSIPVNAVIAMGVLAGVLIIIGGLELILEFGSITFLLVSTLVAIANYDIHDKTNASRPITIIAIVGLLSATSFILYYEFTHKWQQMVAIVALYIILGVGAYVYAKKENVKG